MRAATTTLLVLLAVQPAALAAVDTACWYRDVEQLDRTVAPPQGGDNEFFTASDVSPNLLWILDNSGSMQAQPCATGDGCSQYELCNGGFDARGNKLFTSRGYRGYSTDAAAYDAADPDTCASPTDPRAFSGKDGCYKPGVVYRVHGTCTDWPADGQVWVRAGASDAASTIDGWCGSNFVTRPANPATSPSSCLSDANCPAGYRCLDATGPVAGMAGTPRCHLPTIDCGTPGYTCPGGYGCNTSSGRCEQSGVLVTPPDAWAPATSCSGNSHCATMTGSSTGYLCRRYDGSTSTPLRCHLGYHGSGFPYSGCNSSGYTCPASYACNTNTRRCEKTVVASAPIEQPGGPTSCTSDGACATGYRCITAGGADSGTGRRCRLPLLSCTTPGYTCPDPANFACNPTSGMCEDVDAIACVQHLKTYGYYPGSDTEDPLFTGDLLNFSPPKFVSARRALKDMVPQVRRTRQALLTFDSDNDYGQVLAHLGPTCDRFKTADGQSVVPPDAEFGAQAASIVDQLARMKFTQYTPLGETLSTACQYLTSDQLRFRDQVMVKGTAGVGWYDAELASRSGSSDSMCFSCQKNFAVVITDGEPLGDEGVTSKLKGYCGTGTGCSSTTYLDDVAMFCNREDLRPDLPGTQNATLHTIAFGFKTPTLEAAAAMGGGVHLAADDAGQLRDALSQIVTDVNGRATSFSVASVTTVQTRGSTYAFVPRFKPSAEELWEGHLYRFKLFNEFASGCVPADTTGTMNADKLSRNRNGDADCDDIYLLDTNDRVVVENADGDYMIADTSQPWNDATGWPVKAPATLAPPLWDAAAVLQARSPATDPRTIHTVLDADGDGVLEPDEQRAFSEANVDALLKPLALGGAAGDVCTFIRKKLAKTSLTERECALEVIKFVRGLDVFDEDKDGARTDPRPRMLGDIFHSSPILVTSPVPSYLCDLGVTTQCLFSLYGPQLTPDGPAAYGEWGTRQKERPQFVVVGSNDGMLHAFLAGEWREGDDPGTPATVEARHLDFGTGRELWAFIPPDLLPRLKRLVQKDGRHELLVDGTPMVRDVWVDDTNPGRKDAEEFHTMVVVGEREGGRGWVGLDVTNPAAPAFRWTWPPPGDTVALESGESWNDGAPGAPPIGPVAVRDANGALARGTMRYREQWAVFLNGGYDPSSVRGRAVHVLDVWTGRPLWRFARSDASSESDPRRHLGSVAAPLALLDLGGEPTTRGRQDGLFDTAVFGDVLGQVWTLRFHTPAEDTDADGLADNWQGARAFVEHAGEALAARNPFFQLAEASIAPDTGSVTVYLGSGDRPNIRDRDGGDCGLVNLGACRRKGCDVELSRGRMAQSGLFVDAEWHHEPGDLDLTDDNHAVDAAGPAAACADPTVAEYRATVRCGSGASEVSGTWDWGLSCDWSDTDGTPACSVNPKPSPFFATLRYDAPTQNSRFYAVRLFDAARRPFASELEAKAYDDEALTDADLGDADAAPEGSTDEDGYYVAYPLQDERTSSAATVLNGCVHWNTLTPAAGALGCGAKVADEGRLYRAHYATGGKSCGTILQASDRATVRTAIVPPPPPTPVVAFNPRTGEVRYSMVAIEPGVLPSQVNVGASDLAGTIYWLEVPREVHECRHGTGTCR